MRFAHIGVIHPHSSGWRSCLLHMPEVDIVAYYDPNSDAARERLPESERAKPLYDDVAALLRQEQPEAVMITLPNDVTPAVIVQAAQAGCHVFAEKTCARTAPEFQPAADAIRRAGVQFGTGYLRRFSPVGVAIKEMVDQGLLGRLISIEARWITTSVGKRDPTSFLFSRQRSGGGMLHWLGCHWLDFIRWATSSEVTDVSAVLGTLSGEAIDVEDTAALALRYDNGMIGSLHCAYATDESTDQLYFGLRGTLGWVRWERSGLELEASSVQPSWETAPTRVLQFTPPARAGYGAGTGCIAIKRMIAAARGNGPQAIATDDARRVLEVLDAAHESDASGRRISIARSDGT